MCRIKGGNTLNYKRFLGSASATLLIIIVVTLVLAPGAWATSKFKTLYEFKGPDGLHPYTGLIFDTQGNLHGTTEVGGANTWGTVFKLIPNPDGTWTESLLHEFGNDDDGARLPIGGLVFDATGSLYGTTGAGGSGCGTVFQLTPGLDGNWTERSIDNIFCQPNGPMILDGAGNLYGTTAGGGQYGYGDVLKLTANADGSWTESVLYSFTGGKDGGYPGMEWPQHGSLVFDGEGNLYGTTSAGGASGDGVAYQLTPKPDGSWRERILHSFAGRPGKTPVAGLVFDRAGNLYGMTLAGGSADAGIVFKLTPGSNGKWMYNVLHVFSGGKDGANPWGSLVLDAAGTLYGTTTAGGAYGGGNVFKLILGSDGKWTERVLHQFTGGTDGWNPYAGVILDAAGNIYGTTYSGGTDGAGVVFEITP